MSLSHQPPRTSIVIVNYNGGTHILECLRSVFDAIQSETEVIVVDNASSDGSTKQIEAMFSGVKLIRAGKNLGFGAGNNLGAGQARGEYVVFLNPDTIVHADWLSEIVRVLEEEKGTALVTPKILLANDPDKINSCGNRVHLTGLTLCRGLYSQSQAFNHKEEIDAVSGAAFAISRDLFDLLGGFDAQMFLYMEDTDLSLRARLAGARCIYTPDSVLEHDYQLKITPMKMFYQERNRYLMLLKNFRWATLAVLLPAHIAAEWISWAFVLLKDRRNFGNKIKAYVWVLANWKWILEQRREVQSRRKRPDRSILRSMAVRLDYGQASSGAVAILAHALFDPFFLIIKIVVLVIVWW